MTSLTLYISLRWWICATCHYKVLVDINATTSRKISVHWEQRKLSLIAKYLDVTLNFLYMWEKANEWKQLRDGCPFQLVRDSTTYEQTHLDFVNKHRFHIRKEQISLLKNWLYWVRSSAPLNFTGHLRFWLQKYLVQNWRELLTVKKISPLLFLKTLSRWKWKMKIWENCNAKGKMTKNKCLSYKIRWLVSPISCWTSPAFRATLLGWWMNGKFSFLNKVAFQFVCKCLWCLYNKQNNTWLLVDMGLLFS